MADPTPDDVTTLTDAIREVTDLWDEPLDEVRDVPPIARMILASSWLADHDRRLRAEAAIEALRLVRRLAVRCYRPSLVSTATVIADLDEAILRFEAGEQP